MKIEKINGKSYRIRKMYKGVIYKVIVPYKPTQKEAIELMAAEMGMDNSQTIHRTFYKAYLDYKNSKLNILSPSTIRGYDSIIRNMPDHFKNTIVSDMNKEIVQNAVNDYAKNHSPKSVKNYYGLITAVLDVAKPNLRLKCTLPQAQKNEPYIPTEKDAEALFEAIRGSKYEVAVKLAALGLRRGEICALDMSDLSGNTLKITKSYVQNTNQEWILKPVPKTTDSTREIFLPDDLVELIHSKGMYSGNPDCISKYIGRLQKRLGMPHFSIHKLRHFYASYAHSMGVPDAYIMEAGGWKTTSVLNAVYKHAMKDKNQKMQAMVANNLQNLF